MTRVFPSKQGEVQKYLVQIFGLLLRASVYGRGVSQSTFLWGVQTLIGLISMPEVTQTEILVRVSYCFDRRLRTVSAPARVARHLDAG
jgi:hypothetical protein